MATQVDVDQACLELNDRTRHPINHFMSCPLDDIQRSRLEVASKIGLSSRRLVGSAAAGCGDLPQRRITLTRDPTDQRCKIGPAPNYPVSVPVPFQSLRVWHAWLCEMENVRAENLPPHPHAHAAHHVAHRSAPHAATTGSRHVASSERVINPTAQEAALANYA